MKQYRPCESVFVRAICVGDEATTETFASGAPSRESRTIPVIRPVVPARAGSGRRTATNASAMRFMHPERLSSLERDGGPSTSALRAYARDDKAASAQLCGDALIIR